MRLLKQLYYKYIKYKDEEDLPFHYRLWVSRGHVRYAEEDPYNYLELAPWLD